MREELLQFIWQYNLYRPGELKTTEGVTVQVIHPGTLNRNAGPDFGMGRIMLGRTTLVGNVELHIRSSDWLRHHHDQDAAYSRVILHVVYEHDLKYLPGGIPVLELRSHIPREVLDRYTSLIQTTAALPCANMLHQVPEITRSNWLGRMLVERWEERLGLWESELKQAAGDWPNLLYRRLAANFGFMINAAPFQLLAESLPLKILTRQSALFQVETLLFGQAGFLAGNMKDGYSQHLQDEYLFLKQKYSLVPIDVSLWKFLRLRPANFPTVRLAQFAALIHQSPKLFTAVSSQEGDKALGQLLSVKASAYWDLHYRPGELQPRASTKTLGLDAVNNIIINTIAPIRFLYAHTHGHAAGAEAALALLDTIPAENNNIIRNWETHGWKPVHAGNSQALIQLYNKYCCNKKCLECAIGLSIIRSRPGK